MICVLEAAASYGPEVGIGAWIRASGRVLRLKGEDHEFSITSCWRRNRTQKPSSTVTMNRHTSEPKCASANRQLNSASNSCRSRQQENDK